MSSSPASRPPLAIVIVSYNVKAELDACLQTVIDQTGLDGTDVVVVDNGSNDGTVDAVRDRWPSVRVVEAGGNIGFARANNVGIRATAGDYVLLLNPDTLVKPGAIETLVGALDAHPEAAAVGPRLVDGQGVPELSFGRAIGPLGELRQKIVMRLHQRGVGAARRAVERWTTAAGPREWVSGACLMVRRDDLAAVGLLDERYFMYTEDVDLCVALRKRGRSVLFVPDAEVVHLRGRSAGRNPETERLRRISQLAYYEKHHPRWLPLLRMYLRATGKLPDA